MDGQFENCASTDHSMVPLGNAIEAVASLLFAMTSAACPSNDIQMR